MPDLNVGGIALFPVIAALVEGAKQLGLPSKWAPLLNAVLSVATYYLVTQFVIGKPEALQPATFALNVVIMFLSAAGVYTTAKFAVGK